MEPEGKKHPVLKDIETLLDKINNGQKGGGVVSDVNTLLNELRTTDKKELKKMMGGAKKSKKTSKKTKSKKTTSKKTSKTPLKTTSKKTKSKSKDKSLKRPENEYFKLVKELRPFIAKQVPNEKFNIVGAFAKAISKIIKNGDRNLEKIKKNFDSTAFLKDYNAEKKAYLAKQAEKKASKA
jgi:hypothetical protein